MDNDTRIQEKMRARDLTAEIDRATDVAVNGNLAMIPARGNLNRAENEAAEKRNLSRAENEAAEAQLNPEILQGGGKWSDGAARVVGREWAQQMGWQVIDGGRGKELTSSAKPATGVELAAGAELISRAETATGVELTPGAELAADVELARDEQELTEAQEFVGEETNLQALERKAEDEEDARNEAGEGLTFENRIVAKNQEGVARAVAPEADKMMNQKSFQVSELERMYHLAVNKMLAVFNRTIGDRN